MAAANHQVCQQGKASHNNRAPLIAATLCLAACPAFNKGECPKPDSHEDVSHICAFCSWEQSRHKHGEHVCKVKQFMPNKLMLGVGAGGNSTSSIPQTTTQTMDTHPSCMITCLQLQPSLSPATAPTQPPQKTCSTPVTAQLTARTPL